MYKNNNKISVRINKKPYLMVARNHNIDQGPDNNIFGNTSFNT